MEKPVYLLLENGDYFEGKSFGAPLREVTGEVVFTTGMTGYLETITDPSYFGQIVVQTFPLIGNYGVIPQDFENEEVYLSAYIKKRKPGTQLQLQMVGDLDTFFKERNIPGVYGIDTRKLAKTIRESGSMNGWLTEVKPPYDAKKAGGRENSTLVGSGKKPLHQRNVRSNRRMRKKSSRLCSGISAQRKISSAR